MSFDETDFPDDPKIVRLFPKDKRKQKGIGLNAACQILNDYIEGKRTGEYNFIHTLTESRLSVKYAHRVRRFDEFQTLQEATLGARDEGVATLASIAQDITLMQLRAIAMFVSVMASRLSRQAEFKVVNTDSLHYVYRTVNDTVAIVSFQLLPQSE